MTVEDLRAIKNRVANERVLRKDGFKARITVHTEEILKHKEARLAINWSV
jgi:hypothetical protein